MRRPQPNQPHPDRPKYRTRPGPAGTATASRCATGSPRSAGWTGPAAAVALELQLGDEGSGTWSTPPARAACRRTWATSASRTSSPSRTDCETGRPRHAVRGVQPGRHLAARFDGVTIVEQRGNRDCPTATTPASRPPSPRSCRRPALVRPRRATLAARLHPGPCLDRRRHPRRVPRALPRPESLRRPGASMTPGSATPPSPSSSCARQTHLRRVAYAICGDWTQAEDLLQTAFAEAVRRLAAAASRRPRGGLRPPDHRARQHRRAPASLAPRAAGPRRSRPRCAPAGLASRTARP